MRVFLTGASGFIGANLVPILLENSCEILALAPLDDPLDRLKDVETQIGIVRGDLTDTETIADAIDEFKPETCIHLAWYAEPSEYLHSLRNIEFLFQSIELLKVLHSSGCNNVLMAGTCAEYDTSIQVLTEDSPARPETLYASAKLSLNLLGQQFASIHNMNFAWARIFYLFGPHEDDRRMVPALIKSLLNGNYYPATKGEQVRDYLYVGDVAEALWLIASSKLNGVYNVCSNAPTTIHHLMKSVEKILGKEDLIQFGSIPYRDWEPMSIVGDNRKLKQAGWRQQFSLDQGLERTVDWWRCRQEQ
jgi:nucleoside-diphosphate-sugar epimerase